MQVNFYPSTAAQREAVEAANREPGYQQQLRGASSVADMRAGTAAIAAHGAVRQPHPDVAVSPSTLGGVPCETLLAPGADTQRTLVYLHGGGFTRGSLTMARGNAAFLAQATGVRVVTVGYRQAPEHRYPAAPQDTLAAYLALRAQGTPAAAMAVVGESSGGCLALGLAAQLDVQSAELPAGIAAVSPMTDLALPGASWHYNGAKDVADLAMGRRLVDLYIDAARRCEPVASPARHHFRGCCPLLIAIGSVETMLSDAERTAFVASEAGAEVQLAIYEGMPHGFTRLEAGCGTLALQHTAQWCLDKMQA